MVKTWNVMSSNALVLLALVGCSGRPTPTTCVAEAVGGGVTVATNCPGDTGGGTATSGSAAMGGYTATSSEPAIGGAEASGGASGTGGTTGGGFATASTTGGIASGGATTGTEDTTGGANATGGTIGSSGNTATAGSQNTTAATGGAATGGAATGGAATGGAATGGAPPFGGCPNAGGPQMVELPLGYCIDSTEVTRGQYKAWLDTSPSTARQGTDCGWNTSYVPNGWALPVDKLDYPVSYVDWCDASAYCRAVGKRLCGKIGGGTLAFDDFTNPALSQWHAACTSNGVFEYPYGDQYVAKACNGIDYWPLPEDETVLPVRKAQRCQSTVLGYEGVYDLSGNVAEWEDSCTGSGQFGYCHVRGGDCSIYYDDLNCAAIPAKPRNYIDAIGIRCCYP